MPGELVQEELVQEELVQEQTEHSPAEAEVEHPSATDLIRSMALSSAELWHSVLQRLEEVSENQRVLASAVAELGAMVQSSLLDPGAASALPARALASLAGELPAGAGDASGEAAGEGAGEAGGAAGEGSARAGRRPRRGLRFRRRRTEVGAEAAPLAEAEAAPLAEAEAAPLAEPGPPPETGPEEPEKAAHDPAAHASETDQVSKKRRRWLRRRTGPAPQVGEAGRPGEGDRRAEAAEAAVPAEDSEAGAPGEPTAEVPPTRVPPIEFAPAVPPPPPLLPPPPVALYQPAQPAAGDVPAPVEPASAAELGAAGPLVLDPPETPADPVPPAPRPLLYTPSNYTPSNAGTAAVPPEPAGAVAPPPPHGTASLAEVAPVRGAESDDDRQYLRPSRPPTEMELAGDVLGSTRPPAPVGEQVGQALPLVISEDITLLRKRRRRLEFRLR